MSHAADPSWMRALNDHGIELWMTHRSRVSREREIWDREYRLSFCYKGKERNWAIAGDELSRGFFPHLKMEEMTGKIQELTPCTPKYPLYHSQMSISGTREEPWQVSVYPLPLRTPPTSPLPTPQHHSPFPHTSLAYNLVTCPHPAARGAGKCSLDTRQQCA